MDDYTPLIDRNNIVRNYEKIMAGRSYLKAHPNKKRQDCPEIYRQSTVAEVAAWPKRTFAESIVLKESRVAPGHELVQPWELTPNDHPVHTTVYGFGHYDANEAVRYMATRLCRVLV
jgi:hypothetical protein